MNPTLFIVWVAVLVSIAGCATAESLVVNGLYLILTEGGSALDRAHPANDSRRWADLRVWVERGRCEREAHQAEWQTKWRWMIGPDWKRYEAEQERIDAELQAVKVASLTACQREYEAQRLVLAE